MNTRCPILLLLLLASPALAQQTSPALRVNVEGKVQSLGIAEARTEVRIYGHLAETKTTLTFANPHGRVLAGDLYFPLPEGATVSGYALDIQGKMIDGVIVKKDRARSVFEEIARQRIDPGLVEWVRGNSFKTRVFPIPAHGTRKIMVRYVAELAPARGGATYHLPMKYKNAVNRFALRIQVVRAGRAPQVQQSPFPELTFKRSGGNLVGSASMAGAAPDKDLLLTLPDVPGRNVLVEKATDGKTYFCIVGRPKPVVREPLPRPKRMTVFWDASASRGGEARRREMQVLRSFLRDQTLTVDLVVFRNTAEKPRRFLIRNGNVEELLFALTDLIYDGGTQVGSISQTAAAERPDFYLLFTDGISNIGRSEPVGLQAPLYIVSSEAATDHPFLHRLAGRTGGRYFNLNRMDADAVAGAIGQTPYSFLSADVRRGTAATFPDIPQPVSGTFLLAGRMDGIAAVVEVNYGFPSGPAAAQRDAYRPAAADAPEGDLLRCFWAQKKLAHLLAAASENEDEIVSLGKEYGLVTPCTSLLVLDSLAQYVEHRIAPPKSLPEMRAAYMQRIDTITAQREQRKVDKTGAVLKMWRHRVAWWDMKFRAPAGPRPKAATQPAPVGLDTAKQALLDELNGLSAKLQRAEADKRHCQEALKEAHVRAAQVAGAAQRRKAQADLTERRLRLRDATEALAAVEGQLDRLEARVRQLAQSRLGLGTPPEEAAKVVISRREDDETKTITRVYDIRDMVVRVPNFAGPRRELDVSEGPSGGGGGGGGGLFEESAGAGAGTRRGGGTTTRRPPSPPARRPPPRPTAKGRPEPQRKAPPGVSVRAWDPKTPYLTAMKNAGVDKAYAAYARQREAYGNSPSFFLDCSDFFLRRNQPALAVQVLSNIAEMELENPALLRVLGHRLSQLGELSLAIGVFDHVRTIRSEEPQSLRDLALALAARARKNARALREANLPAETVRRAAKQIAADYARALTLLNRVVTEHWDRFQEIELIALMEANRILPLAQAAGVKDVPLDQRLVRLLACDLRIVLTWDADETDIDLWVTEPTGEKVSYTHRLSRIGGIISRDFTDGYGPEEYVLHRAVPGVYRIQANYYGSDAARILGPVTLRVDIFMNFGQDNETHRSVTFRLRQQKQTVTVAEIKF